MPKGPRTKALVWVVRPGDDAPEVLLLQRTPKRGGAWHPVTGKADKDEAPDKAALREALEETGLHGTLQDLRWAHAFETDRGPMLEHCFALHVRMGSEPKLSDEHVAHRWVPLAAAKRELEWPSHLHSLDLLEQALARKT